MTTSAVPDPVYRRNFTSARPSQRSAPSRSPPVAGCRYYSQYCIGELPHRYFQRSPYIQGARFLSNCKDSTDTRISWGMIHVNCLFSHTFGCPNDHRPQTPVAPCHLLNCATPAPFGRTTAHTIRLILGRTISPLSFHDIPVVTYLAPLLYRFCATPALNGLNTL